MLYCSLIKLKCYTLCYFKPFCWSLNSLIPFVHFWYLRQQTSIHIRCFNLKVFPYFASLHRIWCTNLICPIILILPIIILMKRFLFAGFWTKDDFLKLFSFWLVVNQLVSKSVEKNDKRRKIPKYFLIYFKPSGVFNLIITIIII